MTASTPSVVLTDIVHRYGAHRAVNGVSLAVESREILCVVGPSGCGKSTLLRLISGLETLQQGTIAVGGRVLAAPGQSLPPERRPVGMMFQDFALFPHMTVSGNIAFGQTDRPRAERQKRVAALLESMALTRYADAYPHTLSGGQQQRVALARALARDPQVLLLDEPFSALDEQLRRSVRDEVVRLIRATGIATIVVTHDPEEAMEIGTRVAVMDGGQLVQTDTPLALYRNPTNSFVARLFGEINRFDATVENGQIVTPLGRFAAPDHRSGDRVEVACRIEDLALSPLNSHPDAVRVRVRHASFLGSSTRICLALPHGNGGGANGTGGNGSGDHPPGEIHARLPGHVDVRAGDELAARVDAGRVMLFPSA